MSRKASETYLIQIRNLSRMSVNDMREFSINHPAFRTELENNIAIEFQKWIAAGASHAAAKTAADLLLKRGLKAGRLEIAGRLTKEKFSASDIGWITRRRNASKKV